MAEFRPENLIAKGAINTFHDTLADFPETWRPYVTEIPSDAAVEQLVWGGSVPEPREFIDGRSIQGMRDFTFNLTNQEFELSIKINRTHFEDDRTGIINMQIQDMAEVWGQFKNSQFATLLTGGGNAHDGTAFFANTRVVGDSANIDNTTTLAAGTGTIPTQAEMLNAVVDAKARMRRFESDQGRPYNTSAIRELRVLVPPTYERAAAEATVLTLNAGGANALSSFATYDVMDELTADTLMYVCAVGNSRKPFIYQERTPVEVRVLDSEDDMALHGGVLVLARQRYVLAFGEFRRAIQVTVS